MPGTTSTGITYPCGGDTMTCAALQTYADTLQAAITNTQALVTSALNPPRVYVLRPVGSPQIVAVGVTTPFTYTSVYYDTATMFNIGAPTILTITSAGTYLVNMTGTVISFPTTLTSLRLAILVNGVEVAFGKSDAGTSTASANTPFNVSAMPISMVPGDQISTSILFTGSGNMSASAQLAATRISTT